ncbi:hypothetical protein BH10CYA1_BH10CYA1_18290 [soil metagenome]
MSGPSTPNSTDANDGRRPPSPEAAQASQLFSEVMNDWSLRNREITFKPIPPKSDVDYLDCGIDDPFKKSLTRPSDNTCGTTDYSKYRDELGNVFVRNATNGNESVLTENGKVIAERDISTSMISDGTGTWSANTHERALTLILENADKTTTTCTIERNSDGTFLVLKYDQGGDLDKTIEQMTASDLHDMLSKNTFKTLENTFDPSTDIASFKDNDGQTLCFDFRTGAFAIGGFGPGHYVFNDNGSVTMPNGDVVTKDGTIIKGSDFHLYLGSRNEPAIEAIQAEAQNYMTNVLAKISSREPVSPAEFSALANSYSALGALGMLSAAASIMQGAVGSVMNDALNMMSRINTALGMNITDSGRLAHVASEIYTSASISAAHVQNSNFDAAQV